MCTMIEKENRIRQIIMDYEDNKISADSTLTELNKLSTKSIDNEWLSSYWNSIGLDTFVKILSTDDIDDWKTIDKARAIALIVEILDNITDDAIIERNSVALEKRYSKPTGTVISWVFSESNNDPNKLYDRLNTNTTLAL
ncbi:MAG: hypothetical protein OEW75_10185 [Cyclobacteriaceae bacterium]|nr:hypothetical protein [Cyclobacteriaceae bacterium]